VKLKRWCCTRCGSTRVYADAWAPLNEEDELLTFDAEHCEACEGPCRTELCEGEVTADGGFLPCTEVKHA